MSTEVVKCPDCGKQVERKTHDGYDMGVYEEVAKSDIEKKVEARLGIPMRHMVKHECNKGDIKGSTLTVEERYCPVCTRTFYGDAINFDGNRCHYCHIEIATGKSAELVAREKRQMLERLSPDAVRKAIREAASRESEA